MADETLPFRRDGNDMANVLFDAVSVVSATRCQLLDVEAGRAVDFDFAYAAHTAQRALRVAIDILEDAARLIADCTIYPEAQSVADGLAVLCRDTKRAYPGGAA
jgi:hypothetical protein